MELSIKDLHLAAYMKMNGAEFIRFDNRRFIFKSTVSECDWRVQHSNSCCRRVDLELIELRKFLK